MSSARPWARAYPRGVPLELPPSDRLLPELLDETALKHPDKIALRFFLHPRLPATTMSYGELRERTNRFANGLGDLGVGKGERVALVLPNSPEYVVAFFGISRVGAIAVNVNPLYVAEEMQHQLQDAGCTTVVHLDALYPRIEKARSSTNVTRCISVQLERNLPPLIRGAVATLRRLRGERPRIPRAAGVLDFGDVVNSGGTSVPEVSMSPDDTALFQYTGGTTGIPKAAMLTHRNLASNAFQVLAWSVGIERGSEVVLGAIPFFHVYGMTTALLYAVASASELVLMPTPRPIDAVLRVLEKSRATIFPGVPTLYVAINHYAGVNAFDLGHVKLCVSGSAPLPVEVQERFEALTGGRLVEGYGLTEASPVTHCNPFFGERRKGSIGVPLPGVDARVVDEDGESRPAGEIGELVVRGPQVMKGYWNREDETSKVLKDGWLYTGDMARMDADGFFYIEDRKKDMINASGLKVFPREVEEVLYRHPKVQEAVVIGVTDPYRGETVKAFVVLKSGETAREEEITSFCAEHLAPYKVPKRLEFRSELPRSAVGKPLRRLLVEEEEKRAASAEDG